MIKGKEMIITEEIRRKYNMWKTAYVIFDLNIGKIVEFKDQLIKYKDGITYFKTQDEAMAVAKKYNEEKQNCLVIRMTPIEIFEIKGKENER